MATGGMTTSMYQYGYTRRGVGESAHLRLPDAQEGITQVAVGLAAVVGDGLVQHVRGHVGEGKDLLAEALQHLLVKVDDAKAVGACTHTGRGRAKGIAPKGLGDVGAR